MKKCYIYDPISFEYLGESFAQPNPITKNWIYPANSTEKLPLEIGPNQVQVWSKSKWVIKDDLRGTKYWDNLGNEKEISEIGELIPEGSFSEKPDLRTLDEIKQEANQTVEQSHAQFLRNLTGNATIEERDTWQAKALACEAISNNTASEIQTEMIATEAQIMGEEIETLITKILTRYGAYQKLIGLASGLKRKTQATIDQCTTKEQIDQVLEQSSQQADQYVQQWMQG